MRGDPIYLRPPDARYRLRSDLPQPVLLTGTARTRQWLLVAGCLVEFDIKGRLVSVADDGVGNAEWATRPEFTEGPIDVLRFWLPDRRLGISDFPLGSCDLPDDPADFSEDTWDWLRTTQWADGTMFTLQLGVGNGELWIDHKGTLHLHSK